MKIERLSIRNFRGFGNFVLEVGGRSLFLIGENGGGKSSLLTAIVRALGRDMNFTRADFRDVNHPIELEVTLSDFTTPQRGLYGNHIQFGPPATLTVGARVVWNAASEEADWEHHYPAHSGSRSRRDERDGFPIQWLPSWRDPARMLQFGASRSLMGLILAALPLGPSLDQAATEVMQASEGLAREQSLVTLLGEARDALNELLPDVVHEAFGMGVSALTARELLAQFELEVQHLGDPVPVTRQSSGIAQLSIFVFALQLTKAEPGTFLLIDEPEVSLHPQAQRALMRHLRKLDAQLLVATHSSNLLDRADPRRILRLKRAGGTVSVVSPAILSDDEARKLARHTSPQTAEAFFARAVILVEGLSDQYALEALADRRNRNLDGEGISIVAIGGASTIGTYLNLFGSSGFGLPLAGLCDLAEESTFGAALQRAGHTINARADMEQIGFFVCDIDLEDELIRAVGVADVVTVIDLAGDLPEFQTLQQQPAYSAASLDDQVRAFARRHKIKYAPLLVDALDLAHIPTPLNGVLNSV
jgi:predicted ATPase